MKTNNIFTTLLICGGIAASLTQSGCKTGATLPQTARVSAAGSESPLTISDTNCLYHSNWSDFENRIWLGADLWPDRLDAWRFDNGELRCQSDADGIRQATLTAAFTPATTNRVICKVCIDNRSQASYGAAGFLLGLPSPAIAPFAPLANRYAAPTNTPGIFAGVTPSGELIIQPLFAPDKLREKITAAPDRPETMPDFIDLVLTAVPLGDSYTLMLQSFDADTHEELQRLSFWRVPPSLLRGHPGLGAARRLPQDRIRVAFTDWQIEGCRRLRFCDEEAGTGPIAATWYSINRNTLRMTAQMMPVGQRRNFVKLQLLQGTDWVTKAQSDINTNNFTADFNLKNLDLSRPQPYRIEYGESLSNGDIRYHYRSGTIAADRSTGGYGLVAAGEDMLRISPQAVDVAVFSHTTPPLGITQNLPALQKWYRRCFAIRDFTRDIPAAGISNRTMTFRRVRIELSDSADISRRNPADDLQSWNGADMQLLWAQDLFRVAAEMTGDTNIAANAALQTADDGIGYARILPHKRILILNRIDPASRNAKPLPGWPIECKYSYAYDRSQVDGYLSPVEIMNSPNAVIQVINENTGKLVYSVRSRSTVLLTRIFQIGHYTITVSNPARAAKQIFEHQIPRLPGEEKVLRIEF